MPRLRPMLCIWLLITLAACAAPAPPAAQAPAPTAAPAPATTAPVPPTSAPTVAQARPTTPPSATQTTAPTAAPAPATRAPTVGPTATQAQPQASAEVNLQSGRLPGGEWFIGNPNAPVTVVDYSDFL